MVRKVRAPNTLIRLPLFMYAVVVRFNMFIETLQCLLH